MNPRDPNIICFILPCNNGENHADIVKQLSPKNSSLEFDESTSTKAIIERILKDKLTDCKQISKETFDGSDDIEQHVARNTNETAPSSKKTKMESKVKKKSKYSDFYANGLVDCIRKDPKNQLRRKPNAREEEEIFEDKGVLPSSNAENSEQKDGIRENAKDTFILSHLNPYNATEKKSCCELSGNVVEENPKRRKIVYSEDECDLKLVQKLIDILKHPKSKHHQDFAIDILRDNKKLLHIFQRERQSFGQQMIPVFRKQKQMCDKFHVADRFADSASGQILKKNVLHSRSANLKPLSLLPRPQSPSLSLAAASATEAFQTFDQNEEMPGNPLKLDQPARELHPTSNEASALFHPLDTFPLHVDGLLMDGSLDCPSLQQNNPSSDSFGPASAPQTDCNSANSFSSFLS